MGNVDESLRQCESAVQDLLNREPHAQMIARLLLLPDESESLVVGISGKWGSGKTFFSKLVVKAIGAEAGVIEFRPWLLTDRDTLVREFFVALGEDLFPKSEQGANIAARKKFFEYVSRIADIGDAIPGSSVVFPFASVTKLSRWAVDRLSEEKPLQKLRAEVSDAVRESGKRVVVVIDDLDRLHRDEILLMLQVVKSCGDLPGVSYLLLYDRDQIKHAISGEVNDPDMYLQKIVQVPHDLPHIDDKGWRQLMQPLLAEVLSYEGDQGESQSFAEFFLTGAFDTPREVLRFTQSALPLLRAHEVDGYSHVHALDFFALEYVRQFFPAIYARIRLDASPSVKNFSPSPPETDQTRWSRMVEEEIDERYSPSQKERATKALSLLAPVPWSRGPKAGVRQKKFCSRYWKNVYLGFSALRAPVTEPEWICFRKGEFSSGDLADRLLGPSRGEWIRTLLVRVEEMDEASSKRLFLQLVSWAGQVIRDGGSKITLNKGEFIEDVCYIAIECIFAQETEAAALDLVRMASSDTENALVVGGILGFHGRLPSWRYSMKGLRDEVHESVETEVRQLMNRPYVWLDYAWPWEARRALSLVAGQVANAQMMSQILEDPSSFARYLNNDYGVGLGTLSSIEESWKSAAARVPDEALNEVGQKAKLAIQSAQVDPLHES